MPVWLLILLIAVSLALVMAAAAQIALSTGKSGWIDAIWSFAVGAAGVAAALVPLEGGGETSARQWLVAAMVAAWSIRLGSHIVSRTLKGGDDPRYAQLMKDWGSNARPRLFLFLQIQAACALVLAITVMTAAYNPAPGLKWTDWLGLAILIASVVGEGIADRQLRAFAKGPANKGKVCDVGLWWYSRHPNYFFEWLGWVAYPVIALNFTGAHPWCFMALAGPMLIYFLLVYASGIPPLEEHMLRTRGEKFRAYQRRVNAFWPGPQKADPQHTEPSQATS